MKQNILLLKSIRNKNLRNEQIGKQKKKSLNFFFISLFSTTVIHFHKNVFNGLIAIYVHLNIMCTRNKFYKNASK